MIRAICTTPRSGSTAIANMLANVDNTVDSITEFCNPRYMTALYGQEWTAKRNNFLADPRMGLKIMYEHMDAKYIPYLQERGVTFLTRLDKFSQAVSFYVSTSTGRWYQHDGHGKCPPWDYDKILLHFNRIISQEYYWVQNFIKYDIDFDIISFEDYQRRYPLPGVKDPVHLAKKGEYQYRFAKAFVIRAIEGWSTEFRDKKEWR